MPALAIFLGIYLLFVAGRGNSKDLANQISQSGGFIKWGVAVGILFYMLSIKEIAPAVKPFIILGAVGFALMNYNTITTQLNSAWNSLGNGALKK